ncbi:Glucosamine-6-phosphate deaminase [isomerizing], alternative [hydrothermal vent metagenome]|uniref:Glucosamine-6-phosphate deaminase [isomerizing], alternative n=1 Tax=hydrothermal vent metagenome TaxID=652676 RepID=A0A3B0VJK9_9ZZZZ
MTERGQHTYKEITTQTDAWADALEAFAAMEDEMMAAWQAHKPDQIIVTGCGSTHYLSQTTAELLQQLTAVPTRAYPASELLLSADTAWLDASNTLLLAISRSGTTTETLEAVKAFRKRNGRSLWTITCYPQSPLAEASDLVFAAEAAQEQSVAQTCSFASMLLLAQMIAATLGGKDTTPAQQLPTLGQVLISQTEEMITTIAQRDDIDRLYFLGSGPQFGIANEAMLKMTEMSLSSSGAFHFMEFRHGPMSMATENALVIGLLSPTTWAHEAQVLHEMRALGAQTLALNPTNEPLDATWQIQLPTDLPAWLLPLLYLPPLQLLAYHRSMSKGLNPDNPRNLTAVITLDTAVFT